MRKLLLFVLLCGSAFAQRTDTCSTAANTSLGNAWTLKQCLGLGDVAGVGNPVTQSITLPSNVTVGDYLVVPVGIAGNYGVFFTVTDNKGNVAAGKVTTVGTAVTFSSGIPFSLAGCSAETGSTCDWNGKSIIINGVTYTISTVNSITSITLTTSAGTQASPVAYKGPSYFCTDTDGDVDSAIMNTCVASVTTGGSDTITTTCHNGGTPGDGNPVCTDATRYVFIIDAAEFSNAGGIGGLDYAACQFSGCLVKGGHTNGSTTTAGSGPSTATTTVTASNTGELIIAVGEFGVGPVYSPGSYFPLIMGVVGGGTGTGCGGVGYCTNENQVEVITRSASGAFTATENDGATGDFYIFQGLALSPGAGFTYAPNPVAFGGVYTGFSGGPTTVTITNNGGASLILGTLSSSSGLYVISSDSCTGQTVNAGNTCTFALTFTPTVAGAASATITVPDNVGNPDTISATGTGLVISSNPVFGVAGVSLSDMGIK